MGYYPPEGWYPSPASGTPHGERQKSHLTKLLLFDGPISATTAPALEETARRIGKFPAPLSWAIMAPDIKTSWKVFAPFGKTAKGGSVPRRQRAEGWFMRCLVR